MPQGNGGVVGPANDPTSSTASGVWGLKEHAEAVGAGKWPGTVYQISRSLRFNSADSAYLSRTPASAGDRKTWTWSGWYKRAAALTGFPEGYGTLFGGGYSGAGATQNDFTISFGLGTLSINNNVNNSTVWGLTTTQVFMDVSAWYHIIVAIDSTQATDTNRVKLYVNGTQVTAFSTANYPSQNYDSLINTNVLHRIGSNDSSGSPYILLNGYLTEINFIDGQALTPSSFGETNATTGVWSPIRYAGSYGTNGFYLNFSDNSDVTATTLGKDQAGSNNWTPNNFSVTAGAGNDSLVDSPMQYGTDTGAGGEVRGNYATWNPLVKVVSQPTFSNGNLVSTTPADWSSAVGTIGLTSGKWYWEIVNGNSDAFVGIVGSNANLGADLPQNATGTILYYGNTGNKRIDSVDTAYGSAFSTQVIGVALDIDGGTVVFYRDNVSQGSISLSSSTLNGKTIFPLSGVISTTATANFGQRPFAYTAPSGFKALCTQNLPESEATIPNGGEYFNAVEYTGNNTANAISGVGFQPDMLWIKRTDAAQTFSNGVFDAVRGRSKSVITNLTIGEQTSTSTNDLVSFDGDGFTLGPSSQVSVNDNTGTYVAWNWKANGSGVSNTDGTITSTVSANTDSGFSIVTYTGTGSAGTVGHGLSVAPSMIIVKNRDSSTDWHTFHASLGPTKYLKLNLTSGEGTASSVWDNTAPTDSVFSIAVDGNNNGSGNSIVAYCFAAIPGYSAFGSYTGNGSADGPFIYTGFRPRFVMIKRTDSSDAWLMNDTSRSNYNGVNYWLQAESSGAESTNSPYQSIYLSNGFKLTGTSTSDNASGGTYIYMAFAESPFKYALAR